MKLISAATFLIRGLEVQVTYNNLTVTLNFLSHATLLIRGLDESAFIMSNHLTAEAARGSWLAVVSGVQSTDSEGLGLPLPSLNCRWLFADDCIQYHNRKLIN